MTKTTKTLSTFTLSIEPVDAPVYQHGHHLGTIERVARDMAEYTFKCLATYPKTRIKQGTAVRTVALMRDGRVFDVFDGSWTSELENDYFDDMALKMRTEGV